MCSLFRATCSLFRVPNTGKSGVRDLELFTFWGFVISSLLYSFYIAPDTRKPPLEFDAQITRVSPYVVCKSAFNSGKVSFKVRSNGKIQDVLNHVEFLHPQALRDSIKAMICMSSKGYLASAEACGNFKPFYIPTQLSHFY